MTDVVDIEVGFVSLTIGNIVILVVTARLSIPEMRHEDIGSAGTYANGRQAKNRKASSA